MFSKIILFAEPNHTIVKLVTIWTILFGLFQSAYYDLRGQSSKLIIMAARQYMNTTRQYMNTTVSLSIGYFPNSLTPARTTSLARVAFVRLGSFASHGRHIVKVSVMRSSVRAMSQDSTCYAGSRRSEIALFNGLLKSSMHPRAPVSRRC
jgi:hypothetical protein